MLAKLQPQKEIEVDGEKYIVQLYSPTFGFRLYAKLLRILGEPIVKIFQMITGKGKNLKELMKSLDFNDLDLNAASEAFGLLMDRIPDDQVVPLIQEILSNTFDSNRNSVVDQFEVLFSGRYNHVFKLVVKTLGVQYPDFLSGILKRQSAVKAAQVSSPAKRAVG